MQLILIYRHLYIALPVDVLMYRKNLSKVGRSFVQNAIRNCGTLEVITIARLRTIAAMFAIKHL